MARQAGAAGGGLTIVVVDGDRLYSVFACPREETGTPVFRFADRATSSLGRCLSRGRGSRTRATR